MSYSWVDPHFAVLYGRREEQRLAEKLLTDVRVHVGQLPELGLPELGSTEWRRSGWLESDLPGSPTLRLI